MTACPQKMKTKNKATGALGEKLAQDYLTSNGYTIIASNYRVPEGEIDLIARADGELVFIEVKARHGRVCGAPEEAVTPAKQAKLIAAAQRYLQENSLETAPWRIDVMAIELTKNNRLRRLELIESAVGQGE
jgi:putative endonuclease